MGLRRFGSLISFALLTGCTVLSGVASLEVGGGDETGEGAQTASSSSSSSSSSGGAIDGGGADVYTKNSGARSDPPEENPPPTTSSSSSSGAMPDAGGVTPIMDASPPPPPPMPVTETFTKTLQEDDRFQYGPFNAKAGTSVEATTTGSGDPDVYLNFGAPATFGNADCSSEGPNADERCRRTTPSPSSPVYVMVYAWGEATTYTIKITYTPGP